MKIFIILVITGKFHPQSSKYQKSIRSNFQHFRSKKQPFFVPLLPLLFPFPHRISLIINLRFLLRTLWWLLITVHPKHFYLCLPFFRNFPPLLSFVLLCLSCSLLQVIHISCLSVLIFNLLPFHPFWELHCVILSIINLRFLLESEKQNRISHFQNLEIQI